MNFTVTKLLSAVDCVLGMDWLQQWNPVIDWRKQNDVFVCKESTGPRYTENYWGEQHQLWDCKNA